MRHNNTAMDLLAPSEALFRVSLKGLILNEVGQVLVVKEIGRDYWDLPGGGLNRGETVHEAIARELEEEVGYYDRFRYAVFSIEDPERLTTRNVWQVRLIANIELESFNLELGPEADAVGFVDPEVFRDSLVPEERRILAYSRESKRCPEPPQRT